MTQPPIAKRIPHHAPITATPSSTSTRGWRTKDDPAVTAYLNAENAYTERRTAHLAGAARDAVRRDQEPHPGDRPVGARPQGRLLVLHPHASRASSTASTAGAPVARRARPPRRSPRDGAPLAGEEVLLDGNELAEGHDFFALGTFDVSPDGQLLAYSTDFTGDERFTLRIKDLRTGELLPDEIPDTFYGTAWSADGSTLFYLTVDDAWRPHRVWRHTLGAHRRRHARATRRPTSGSGSASS